MKKIIYAVVGLFSAFGLIVVVFLAWGFVQNKKEGPIPAIVKTQGGEKESKTTALEGKVSLSALIDKNSDKDSGNGILFLEFSKEVEGAPRVISRYRFPNPLTFPMSFKITRDKYPFEFSDKPLIVSAQYWKSGTPLVRHADYFSKSEFVRNWNEPTAHVDLYLLPTYAQAQQSCQICEFSGAVHLAPGAKEPTDKYLYIGITNSLPTNPQMAIPIGTPLRFSSGVANFKKSTECFKTDFYRFVMFSCPTGTPEKACLSSKNLVTGNPIMAFSKYTCDLTNKQFFFADEHTDKAKLYTEELAKFKN
jgi:hypothetical protein